MNWNSMTEPPQQIIIQQMIKKGYFHIKKLSQYNLIANEQYTEGRNLVINFPKINRNQMKALKYMNKCNIQLLTLYLGKISDVRIKSLLFKQWPDLHYLDIQSNEISSIGFNLIMNSSLLPKLQTLIISQNCITQIDMSILSQNNCISRLKVLNISRNNIGSAGVKLITKADTYNLQILKLQQCNIGYQGLKHLSKLRVRKIKQISFGFVQLDVRYEHLTNYQLARKSRIYSQLENPLPMFYIYMVSCSRSQLSKLLIWMSNSKMEKMISKQIIRLFAKRRRHQRMYMEIRELLLL